MTDREALSLAELRTELRTLIAAHKLPRKLKLYADEIPRNVSGTLNKGKRAMLNLQNMGKVNKKALAASAFPLPP